MNTDGGSGGTASVTLDVDGDLYTITANGGSGGQAGNSGGAGGAGGFLSIPASLVTDSRFQFSTTNGIDGADGGDGGAGAFSYGGGGELDPAPLNRGGNGSSTAFESTTNVPTTRYTNNGSWTIPTASASEIGRSITVRISGGGGGNGNPNANSGCSASWPGWPTSTSGKSGACGGYGGRGARLIGTLTQASGTLSWEIGRKGNAGFNNKDGNTGTGSEAGPSIGGIGGW